MARARSAKKMGAPFRTASKRTDSPASSLLMSAPIAATRSAICSRVIRTFSSFIAFHGNCYFDDRQFTRSYPHPGLSGLLLFAQINRMMDGIHLRHCLYESVGII